MPIRHLMRRAGRLEDAEGAAGTADPRGLSRPGRRDLVLAVAFVAWVLVRPLWDVEALRLSFAALIGAAAVLAAAALPGMPVRKDASVRAWQAMALTLALSLPLGALDAVTPMGDQRIGFALIVLLGVGPIVWSLAAVLRFADATLEDVLDSAMVALIACYVLWEVRFEPDVGSDTAGLAVAGLVFVGAGLMLGTLSLLSGRSTGYGRARILLSGGLLAEAFGILLAPNALVGGRFADNAVGSAFTSGGAVLLALALWTASRSTGPTRGREDRSLLWWAPATFTITIYVAHEALRPDMGGRLDPVATMLLLLGSACLIGRIVATVSARESLTRVVTTDRERLATLLHDVADHVALVDADGTVTWSGGGRPSGLMAGEVLVGRNLLDVLAPGGRREALDIWWQAVAQPGRSIPWEGPVVRRDGSRAWVEALMVNRTDDPVVGSMLVTFRDITARRDVELAMRRMALHDDLTGLANRQRLIQVIEEALAAQDPTTTVTVLYLDVDRLKLVNDSLGHHVGDRLIAEVARRWDAALPATATIGRVGGDEFVVCYPHRPGDLPPLELADTLLRCLAVPVIAEGRRLTATASVGVANVTDGGEGIDLAIREADSAMYAAKARGRDRVAVFTPDLRAAAHDRLTFEEDLREALADNRLAVHLQPIVNLRAGRTTSLEALLRWKHPQRGWVPPDRILQVAEETGLLAEVGGTVLRQTCAAIAEVRRATGRDLQVAVNVSPSQLEQAGVLSLVEQALREHDLPFSALVLEITEHTLLAEVGAGRTTLRALHETGVGIGLDDFGTGFSALSYLGSFPLDALKLDRSMVVRAVAEASGAAVLQGTLSITESLGLDVVAEGVETVEQLAWVESRGVSHAQGWLFAAAVPPEELVDAIGRADDIARTALAREG